MLKINNSSIELVEGDITELAVDAVVNPANAQLVLGGGVAGAIRKKGGPTIQKQCNEIGGISVGQAVMTGAGLLKAKHVIHAVGPVMGEGDEDQKLHSATLNSLNLAKENGLGSMAFPAISTGIFGFPIDRCAKIMLAVTIEFLKCADVDLNVVFCLFDPSAFAVFQKELVGTDGFG